jgi:hypothetical protein
MRRPRRAGIMGRFGNTAIATTNHLASNQVPTSSNGINTNKNRQSKLLSLPPEVRAHIWRDVLTSSTGYVKPIWGNSKTGNDGKSLIEFHYYAADNDLSHFVHREERIHLSILLTKDIQLYHECAYTFWKVNTFVLDPLNQHGFPQALDLSTSFYRKIQHVQFNFSLSQSDLLIFPVGEGSRREEIRTALAVLEKMADSAQGSLKSLTIKPVAWLVELQVLQYTVSEYPRFAKNLNTILEFFGDERKNLAWIRRKVEIDLLWEEYTYDEQQLFHKNYQPQATDTLHQLLRFMGGPNGTMWVDGKIWFAYGEHKTLSELTPFPMKERLLKKEEIEKSDSWNPGWGPF